MNPSSVFRNQDYHLEHHKPGLTINRLPKQKFGFSCRKFLSRGGYECATMIRI